MLVQGSQGLIFKKICTKTHHTFQDPDHVRVPIKSAWLEDKKPFTLLYTHTAINSKILHFRPKATC